MKKHIAFFLVLIVFLQNLAWNTCVYMSFDQHYMESRVDLSPSDSWESEDGVEKDGLKEIFSTFLHSDSGLLFIASLRNATGEPPSKKAGIGYIRIQSPPPDTHV